MRNGEAGRNLVATAVWTVLLIAVPVVAQAAEWEEVRGEDALRRIYENTVVESKGARGEYCADGTGTIFAWGERFPRTWTVKGDDQVCVESRDSSTCYTFERNTSSPSQYRATDTATEDRSVFEISHRKPKSCG
jgi:hypothetical protein